MPGSEANQARSADAFRFVQDDLGFLGVDIDADPLRQAGCDADTSNRWPSS